MQKDDRSALIELATYYERRTGKDRLLNDDEKHRIQRLISSGYVVPEVIAKGIEPGRNYYQKYTVAPLTIEGEKARHETVLDRVLRTPIVKLVKWILTLVIGASIGAIVTIFVTNR